MKKFCKCFVTVFTDKNGKHKVMLPSGEEIPHLVKTVTTDDVLFSTVQFDMACNVVATKEEALEKYKAE
jgi:hypothetical protein